MKKAWTEKDIENLIKDSAFPNPAHKNALRDRLSDKDRILSLEDLELVAGGKSLPDSEVWEEWPAPGKEKP